MVRNDLARVLLALAEEGDCDRAMKLIESSTGASVAVSDATRGSALVGVGRYDEGFGVLQRALSDRSDGFASAFLALAAIRLGRLDVARNAAREAFVLFRFEGLTVAEVSRTMAAPVKTTESRLRRATELLSARLRKHRNTYLPQ